MRKCFFKMRKMCLGWGLLSCLLFWTGPETSALISIEQETAMGRQFIEAVRGRFEISEDHFTTQYLNDLGRYLEQSVDTQYFPMHFYFINDDSLNGFAGPGGHICIFTGLLDSMHDADELAAVLCHEMGHVSARHIAHRIEQSQKMSLAVLAGMLAGAIIGKKPGQAIATGSMAAGVQKMLNNSREDEREADQSSYKYMNQSGFNPNGMLMVLKTLSRDNLGMTNQIPPYLLTHPTDVERISNIEIMLKAYHAKSKKTEVEEFRKLFPFVKATLRAKYQKAEDAERAFRQELEKGANNAAAYFGLGMVAKERADYDKAIMHLQKAAESQAKSLPILRNLGETYLLKGDYELALRILTRALEIDNQDPATLRQVADTYQYMEKFQKAAEIYEKLIYLDKADDDAYYQLGIAYGRQEKLGLAHYYFGIHFKRIRKMDEAKFHFQKALGLTKNDPALRSRIEKAMQGV